MTPVIIDKPGHPLPPDARAVLFSILSSASIPSCRVSSVARTPAQQASAMYDNLTGTGPNQGVADQLSLYKDPGDEVIKVYESNSTLPKDQILALMTSKIISLGPSTVSHHCQDPSIATVFDVAPSSIAADLHDDFERAVAADKRVSLFLRPNDPKCPDPAYHLEVPRFNFQIPT